MDNNDNRHVIRDTGGLEVTKIDSKQPKHMSATTVGFSSFTWEDSRYQTAVRTEDTDKATSEVTGSFDGVEEASEQQKEGIVNYIQRKDILAVLPTSYGNSLLFRLLPGICHALNTMGYTTYSKKAIILVICPLNALIESHMKELLHIAQLVSIPV